MSLKSRLQSSYFSMYNSSITTDSMIFVLLLLGIFCHLAACSWVLITHVDLGVYEPSWIEVEELFTSSSTDIYVCSLYFIVQTMTTVGYGDLSVNNTSEFMLEILLKLAGVFLFSLVQSFFLHIVEDIKHNMTIHEEKINRLNKLQFKFQLQPELYHELLIAISHEKTQKSEDLKKMIASLPPKLRKLIQLKVYRDLF